ncbi:MAG: nucleoside kinase, partial [Otoolea sp.]
MPKVTIGSEVREYPVGTSYAEIAAEFQDTMDNDILLVSANGRLRELHKQLKEDCSLRFLTAADKEGFITYQRSAVFLMLKAFFDVAGKENVKKLVVCFSMGNGLYVEPEGQLELSEELLWKVKAEMERLVTLDLPLQKRSENTDDAVELFH